MRTVRQKGGARSVARSTRALAFLAVMLGSLLVFTAGCSSESNSDEVSTPDGTVKVEEENGDVSVETSEGQAEFSGSELPKNFPTDIPLPAEYTVKSGGSLAGGETAFDGVVLTVPDSVADAQAYYQDALPSNGWTVQTNVTNDQGMVLIGEKSGRTLTVTVTEEGGATQVTLSATS